MHGEGYIGHGYGAYSYSFGSKSEAVGRKSKNFGVQAAGVQAAGVRPDAVPFPPMPELTQETKPEPVSMTEPWPVPTTFDALLCSTKDDKTLSDGIERYFPVELRQPAIDRLKFLLELFYLRGEMEGIRYTLECGERKV